MNFNDYVIKVGEVKLLEPCFCIALFTDELITEDKASEGLLTPYRVFLDDYCSDVNWILTDGDDMRGKTITSKLLNVLGDWLKKNRKTVFMGSPPIEIYAGKNADEVSLPFLHWNYNTCISDPTINYSGMSIQELKSIPKRGFGHYRIKVSLEHFNRIGQDGVVSLLNRMLKDFPISFGYAGFSLAYNDRNLTPVLEGYISQWLKRYPGLVNPKSYTEDRTAGGQNAITGLGWLTILNQNFCQRLGGNEFLAQRLKGYAEVTELSNGILIRIGDTPLLGDAELNDYLNSYQYVGNILRPVFLNDIDQSKFENIIPAIFTGDKNERTQWVSRFFNKI